MEERKAEDRRASGGYYWKRKIQLQSIQTERQANGENR